MTKRRSADRAGQDAADWRARRAQHRLIGSRVVCVAYAQILLVEHEDPTTGERCWLLPGGGREPGESLEQTALRETREETGIRVRLIRRLRVPAAVSNDAIFLAEPLELSRGLPVPAPTVDLSAEVYLRGAAWHPITRACPLGPLNPSYSGYLAPLLARLAE